MKLSFYGAAHEVTGSCYHLQVNGKEILIDCGLQQGQDVKANQSFPFSVESIDAVILTHAHIDHSGRLPLLAKLGYEGPIYTTGATQKLIGIMLEDSAHIQEMEAEWANRKGKRAGKPLVEPLYGFDDVYKVSSLVIPFVYGEKHNIFDGVELTFTDAGHLLGSASVQLQLKENGNERKIVFSGDIGNFNQPIIRDPQYIKTADYVVMESTYGDRNHEHLGDYAKDLAQIIDKTIGRGGNVIIPSFAVGRAQELLYLLREIKKDGLVTSKPDFKVYLDSPLARKTTQIYDGDLTGYADKETVEILKSGASPTIFEDLIITESAQESKELNINPEPKVIISASGMCEAGRIRHHLKHNLWRNESTVIFVGYQANGTLGRIIVDGVKKVKLFGEEIAVNAEIISMRGLSAHADRDGLLAWIGAFKTNPSKVFVTHGDEKICDIFTRTLKQLGYDSFAPFYHAQYDLIQNKITREGIAPEELEALQKTSSEASRVFLRLVETGTKLMSTIKSNEGTANADIKKFTDEINKLIEKWNRQA